MAKIARERWKIWNNVFDEFTLRTIFKLSSQGHFDELESPVSIGKEANIFTAIKGDGRVIVKIYRLESCDFNKMYDYIKYDPRYQGLRKQRRKIIFAWCQREFRNLLKSREAQVSVPTPIAFLNNVLVEEFIGFEKAAPKLKDAVLNDPKKTLSQVIDNMRKIHSADLVHGDLSEFNILYHNEFPILIDFSQASPLRAENARELLDRDIKNISRFFNKRGLKTAPNDLKSQILDNI